MTEQELLHDKIGELFAKIDLMKIALVCQGHNVQDFEALHESLITTWRTLGGGQSEDRMELVGEMIQITEYWRKTYAIKAKERNNDAT